MTRSSLGPQKAEVALKKMMGSVGMSIPDSSAWSLKLRPMQMILLGRQSGEVGGGHLLGIQARSQRWL